MAKNSSNLTFNGKDFHANLKPFDQKFVDRVAAKGWTVVGKHTNNSGSSSYLATQKNLEDQVGKSAIGKYAVSYREFSVSELTKSK